MKKSTAAILIAVVAVLGIIGVVYATNNTEEPVADNMSDSSDMTSMNKNNTSGSQASGENQVISDSEVMMDIKDFDFSKPSIEIKKGTKVTWTNRDSAKHDITPDKPSASFVASELLAQGESYSFTFDTVGSYSYFCSPHPYMKAMIKVVE